MYYLFVILFSVGWILISIVKNYISKKSPISHKYLNHGTIVPARKCYKIKFNPFNYKVFSAIRLYSNSPNNSVVPKVYDDMYSMKKIIINENKYRSGIYMITNKLTGDFYIGQSTNISNRFINYFNISYLSNKKGLLISRALIKYGYSNFFLTILEYCNNSDLLIREQYYFDNLKPQYNILKIAGSSHSHKLSEKTKAKISKALKGVYIGENSALFGRLHTEKTKELMSLKKAGKNNPLYGKCHSEKTKDLMKKKALGIKHSEETKLIMSTKRGNLVNIYEKCSSEGFKLIGSFVSARRAAKFLEISGSTIRKYVNSGAIFKERYKFSSK